MIANQTHTESDKNRTVNAVPNFYFWDICFFTLLCSTLLWCIPLLLHYSLLFYFFSPPCHVMLCPAHFRLRASERKTHWHLQLPDKQTNEMKRRNEGTDS